jgi:hypothetical protein
MSTLSFLDQSALLLQGSPLLHYHHGHHNGNYQIIIEVFIALGILAIKSTPCRFLEETDCIGMCTNLCKVPSQTFIKHSFGMPVNMVPSKYSPWATICIAGQTGIGTKFLYVCIIRYCV